MSRKRAQATSDRTVHIPFAKLQQHLQGDVYHDYLVNLIMKAVSEYDDAKKAAQTPSANISPPKLPSALKKK